MASTVTSTNNLSLRSILEKDKLTGSNFLDWERNLMIVLRHERKWYVLEEPLGEAPPANAPAAARNAHKKHSDDLLDVACLMLATMSPDLQAGLINTNAYDMIRQLRDMFQTQARTERYDATKAFNECKMVKGTSVSDHVMKMKRHLDHLERLGHPVPLQLATDTILNSLSEDYRPFVVNYNMNNMEKTIAELHSMLKTAELNMGNKNKTKDVLMVKDGGVKKKNGHASTSKGKGPVQAIQSAPKKSKGKGKGKKVKPNKARTENRCFICNEIGHWRQNCPKRHEAGRNHSSTQQLRKVAVLHIQELEVSPGLQKFMEYDKSLVIVLISYDQLLNNSYKCCRLKVAQIFDRVANIGRDPRLRLLLGIKTIAITDVIVTTFLSPPQERSCHHHNNHKLKMIVDQFVNVDSLVENQCLVLQLNAGLNENYDNVTTNIQKITHLLLLYEARVLSVSYESEVLKLRSLPVHPETCKTSVVLLFRRHTPDVVEVHIHSYGFQAAYKEWVYHGEEDPPSPVVDDAAPTTNEMIDVTNDIAGYTNTNEEYADEGTTNQGGGGADKEPVEQFEDVETKFYPGILKEHFDRVGGYDDVANARRNPPPHLELEKSNKTVDLFLDSKHKNCSKKNIQTRSEAMYPSLLESKSYIATKDKKENPETQELQGSSSGWANDLARIDHEVVTLAEQTTQTQQPGSTSSIYVNEKETITKKRRVRRSYNRGVKRKLMGPVSLSLFEPLTPVPPPSSQPCTNDGRKNVLDAIVRCYQSIHQLYELFCKSQPGCRLPPPPTINIDTLFAPVIAGYQPQQTPQRDADGDTDSIFVKSFPCPQDPKRKLFKQRQEGARKDVERAFGVLQSRWVIIKGPSRLWHREELSDIMRTCIILHNMIVEDEGDMMINWIDEEVDNSTQIFQGSTHEFQEYLQRNSEICSNEVHHQLRADLVEHIWSNRDYE
ncbi:hypothetical protein OSB04_010723 [Centaurea solstitialis]|uniref:CCHC-type domain-containing protein n=1 Tax=Centaurea solstitialis TaxID=347529 RepID=A0AA38T849_9ASTR|nr:hypothetical protein OSB04_010723 [Centaurea solstitialis]